MKARDTAIRNFTRKVSSRTSKKRLLILTALLVAVAAALILYRIYIAKDLTWQQLYGQVDIQTVTAPQVAPLEEGTVSVSFLSVGQADCTIIRDGDYVVMIDAGDYLSRGAIFEYLDANGIRKIDYLIATHPHTDHIGSMGSVIRGYEIGEIFFTNHPDELTPTNDTYTNLLKTIRSYDVRATTMVDGQTIQLTHGVLTVLFDGGYDDLNNCSLVLRYEYGDAAFLLMGDAQYLVEDYLTGNGLVQPADVLKAGHHGASNATSMELLYAAEPRYVVASCGADNSYGYPKEAFMNRVDRAGAILLRTDTMGDIVFTSDGKTVRCLNEKDAAA